MNRQQAINYLKSSGFSDEQIKILIKSLDPDIRWMRQAIDQFITDVFSAACNEDFLYDKYLKQIDVIIRSALEDIDEKR